MNRSILPLLTALFLVLNTRAENPKPIPAPVIAQAKVTAVTVYFSGAEITHQLTTHVKKGTGELIIENIANDIDAGSVQVKAPAGITVTGVEFTNNYLPEKTKTPRVQLLTDSLEGVEQQRSRVYQALATIDELRELLKTNRDIRGEQTGLQVAELSKMVNFYKTKMQELHQEAQEQEMRKKKLTEQITRLKSQIEEETAKNELPVGRLILQLSATMSQQADFTVTYMAKNASWEPFFDVRVTDTNHPLALISKARITQTTGIDWHQVKLSLSSALPAKYGVAPELQPWYLRLLPAAIPQAGLTNSIKGKVAILGKVASLTASPDLQEVVVVGYGAQKKANLTGAVQKPLYIVDGKQMTAEDFASIAPNRVKEVQVLKTAQATAIYGSAAAGGAVLVSLKSGLEDYVREQDKNLSLVYHIELPYDVPATGKAQTAVIKKAELPVLYQYDAMPALDDRVYLTASIADWQQQNLLPGSANIIYDNSYVGKTFINPHLAKDTLSLTIANDKRIAVSKQLLKDFSSTRIMNSNKTQHFAYEIAVKNNKNEAVQIRLSDRYPISTQQNIEVKLDETGDASIDKEKGQLHWTLNLAPGERKTVRFSYQVRYPKESRINL